MNSETPTSYDELIELLAALPLLIREKRRRDGLTLRAAGKATGLSFSTVYRVEQGESDPTLSHVIVLLRWLGRVHDEGES